MEKKTQIKHTKQFDNMNSVSRGGTNRDAFLKLVNF